MQANVEKGNSMLIRFKSRNATNQSDKGITEQYNQGGPFDVELQTTDGKSVPAHRFVLVTFSKAWANTLRTVGVDGVISLPISEPYNVVKKLVELLYMREIHVLEDEKQPILDALKLLKICGIDDGSKVQTQVSTPAPAKIGQQRRATLAVVSHTPVKRTAQRTQSTYPDSLLCENNMPPPSQRPPPNTNVVSNPNRNSINMTEMKLSQSNPTKIPRSVNANGGMIQSTPARQQLPSQQQQHESQMIAQNRQSTQNRMAALDQLQKCGNLTVKMQNPAATQKPMTAPSPSPQKPAHGQATQIQSKLPADLMVTPIKQTRNNQQSQQQQQLVARTAQNQSAITIFPLSSMNHTENAAAKNVASAEVAVIQNGQNGIINQNNEIEVEIDNLPIDMDCDEAIGNGKTNDEQDNGVEDVGNGGDDNQSKLDNGLDDSGIEDTVTNNDVEHQNQDPFDDEDDGYEFNDDFEGYYDINNNNNTNAKHHELQDILSGMQDNVTQ